MLAVLHVLTSLKMGGAETFTISLAQLQREQGLDAQILNLGSKSDFLVDAVKSRGIPLHISETTASRLSRFREINQVMRDVDVIHVHSPRALHYIAPLVMLNHRKTCIYTRHGLDPLRGSYWRILHILMKHFISRVTFVTRTACDVFQQGHHWPRDQVKVIENGVRIPPGASKVPGVPLRFGSVGRMVPLKGQQLLLKAMQLMQRERADNSRNDQGEATSQKFVLHFFGAGPEEASLKALAADVPRSRIIFHGEVTDIAGIYGSIDVLIVASQTEGLSMVIIEAMARGIPVIATAVGGNPTLVKPDETGVLVPYGDLRAMQAAVQAFIDDPGLVQSLGTRARDFVAQRYSLMNTHAAFLDCYRAG